MDWTDFDCAMMQRAIQAAQQAAEQGEVPVGAVLTQAEHCLAVAGNAPIRLHDPSAHAEVQVLRQVAQQRQNYRLPGTTLYVTLEPCAMCVGALIQARVARVIYGASDARAGALQSAYHLMDSVDINHRFSFQGGLLQQPCGQLLIDFFAQRRQSER